MLNLKSKSNFELNTYRQFQNVLALSRRICLFGIWTSQNNKFGLLNKAG